MKVETFECTETAAEPLEASEEAIGIINDMGLEGQQALIVPAGDNETRCPYRKMTGEEQFVYGVLCPEKTPLEEYNGTPIPLRILQLAAHAKSLDIFKKLEVWDKVSVIEKDPVLVGIFQDPENTWREESYILGRWGEVLEPFAVLLKRAIANKRADLKSQTKSAKAKAELDEKRVAAFSDAEIVSKGAESGCTYYAI